MSSILQELEQQIANVSSTVEKTNVGTVRVTGDGVAEAQATAVLLIKIGFDTGLGCGVHLDGALDDSLAAFYIKADESLQRMQDSAVVAWFGLNDQGNGFAELILVQVPVWSTEAKNSAGCFGCVLGNLHGKW